MDWGSINHLVCCAVEDTSIFSNGGAQTIVRQFHSGQLPLVSFSLGLLVL